MRASLGAIAVVLAVNAAAIAPVAGESPAASREELLTALRLTPLDGQPAPAFTLSGADRGQVSLADLRGRVLLLYFWASW